MYLVQCGAPSGVGEVDDVDTTLSLFSKRPVFLFVIHIFLLYCQALRLLCLVLPKMMRIMYYD